MVQQKIGIKCKICGKKFFVYPSVIRQAEKRHSRPKYCSKACQGIAYRGKANPFQKWKMPLTEETKHKVEKLYFEGELTQRQIAEMFNVSQATVHNFMKKLGIKARLQPRFKKGYKPTEAQLKALEKGKRFRFKKGQSSWRNGTANKAKCDYCGAIFDKSPSKVKNHSFCSRECYLKYLKEHGAEFATIPKPNEGELKLLKILKAVSEDWRFTGDGSLWIKGKNPDFWDGKQHLVELFGGSWHSEKEAKERINHFREHGYLCIVVWYSELRKIQMLKNKIEMWVRNET
jgi:DNA-binding Lrp family transcriptional regulator